MTHRLLTVATALLLAPWPVAHAQSNRPPAAKPDARLEQLKVEALAKVDGRAKLVQEIVDMVFSFGELGMQEIETSKYLTGILEQNGFTIERGVAGIPTAWVAKWGSGKPVIALGSDIDGIPQASQKPAVGFRDAMIAGAPGHGEGHNSGQAVNIAAAISVKEIMERDKIPGTLLLWPVSQRSSSRPRRITCARESSRTSTPSCSRTWQRPRRVVGTWRRQRDRLGGISFPRTDSALRRVRRGAASRRSTP